MPSPRTDFISLPSDASISRVASTLRRLRAPYVIVRGPGQCDILATAGEIRVLLDLAEAGQTLGETLRRAGRGPTPRLSIGPESIPPSGPSLIVQGSRVLGFVDPAPRVPRIQRLLPQIGPDTQPGTRPRLEPPDLNLLITEERAGHDLLLHFRLTTADDRLGDNLTPHGPIALRVPPSRFFHQFFEEIDASRRPASPSRLLGDPEGRADRAPLASDRRLAARGLRLFREVLPPSLRDRLWQLRDRLSTVLIQSEEPWIPWELCKLQGRAAGRTVEGPFFAEAFELARWLPGVSFRSIPRLGAVALVQPADSNLPASARESAYLQSLAGPNRRVEPIPATTLDVQDAMAGARFDAWHFTGHGVHRHDDPERSAILLESGDRLTPEDLGGIVGNLGMAQPLIFLNACQTGLVGSSLTDLGGWAAAFLRHGASAFLGASWQVDDAAACRFARSFYSSLLAGQPIARAVRLARLAIRRPGDPSWLAYTLFAHPDARCTAEDRLTDPAPSTPPP